MSKRNESLTITVVANMTANYSDSVGNISNIQKFMKGGRVRGMRSKESLKNAIMLQSGLYEDVKTVNNGVAQKYASEDCSAVNCRALEAGYMHTGDLTLKRNSSFYLTDAVSCDDFVSEPRFHNNLHLATTHGESVGAAISKKDAKKESGSGLMPFNYEYDKGMKVFSFTIDLTEVGKDPNFKDKEASNEEKAYRVNSLLDAIENLNLVVKGNLDNAEPLFVAGGIVNRKTHYFENCVSVKNGRVLITPTLVERVKNGCEAAVQASGAFANEKDIIDELSAVSVHEFFTNLKDKVNKYYEV